MSPKLMDWEGEWVPKVIEIWMLACINKSLKNRWVWRPTLKKIVEKTFPKTTYFSHAFFNRFWRGLGRVLGGFWEGFGSSLASLGALLSLFFLRLCCQEGPRGSKRWPRGLLGSIWDAFGRVFGRGLGGFWRSKCVFFWYFLHISQTKNGNGQYHF